MGATQQDPIDASLERLEEISTLRKLGEEEERRRHARKLIKIINDDIDWLVTGMPDESRTHRRDKPHFLPSFVPHVMRKLSRIYAEGPSRSHEDDSEVEQWERILWGYGDTSLTSAIRSILPKAILCGQVLVMPAYEPVPDWPASLQALLSGEDLGEPDAEADGLALRVWTPDQCVVLEDRNDPRYAEAMILQMGRRHVENRDARTTRDRNREVERWWYFDAVHFCELDISTTGMERVSDFMPHGYGRIPVVPLRTKDATDLDCYWQQTWGGESLIPSLEGLYQYIVELMWTALLQRGQPVIYSDDHGQVKAARLAPDDRWDLAPQDKAEILAGNANLTGMQEIQQNALFQWAKTKGLPTSIFRLEPTQAASGVAIALENEDITEQENALAEVMTQREIAIARAGLAVYNQHRRVRGLGIVELTPDGITITYPPRVLPMSADERSRRAEMLHGKGLMADVDFVLTLMPELSRNEAEAMIERAEEEQAARPEPPPAQSPVDAILNATE